MESTLRGSVPAGTRLIETFGWTPDAGYARLDRHLARMANSAGHLGYGFDAAAAKACLKAQGTEPLRCRLTLGEDGFEFTSARMAATPAAWNVAISDQRLSSENPWLQHKTTQRALYDVARETLPDGVAETHVSLFDGSNCGIAGEGKPIFSVQYHPEASPGPQDSFYLFERFAHAVRDHANEPV